MEYTAKPYPDSAKIQKPVIDHPRIKAPAKEIIEILNKHKIELFYLDDVFENVKAEIMLHTIPYKPE